MLGTTPMYIGCYTADSHYALIKVTNVRVSRGEVKAQSWYQLVPGLRLVAH
jgi:hypothetical protein